MPRYRIEATETVDYRFTIDTDDYEIPDDVDVNDVNAVRDWLTGTDEGQDVMREEGNDSNYFGSDGVELCCVKPIRFRKAA